jgi:hypothetical protein
MKHSLRSVVIHTKDHMNSLMKQKHPLTTGSHTGEPIVARKMPFREIWQ